MTRSQQRLPCLSVQVWWEQDPRSTQSFNKNCSANQFQYVSLRKLIWVCHCHSFNFKPTSPVQLLVSQSVSFCHCYSVCFKQMYINIYVHVSFIQLWPHVSSSTSSQIIISLLVSFCHCHPVCFEQIYTCMHACVIHSALTPWLQFNFQSVMFSQLSSVS